MRDELLRHGAFSWFELMTDKVEESREFYGRIFGWTIDKIPMDQGEYWVVKVDGEDVGGIMQKPPQASGAPNYWGTYIAVNDADKVADAVQELGGQIIVPPTDIPGIGRFTTFMDPHGAVLSAITYATEEK